jgi:4-hydroxyphenylacetate 3-monooxygenase
LRQAPVRRKLRDLTCQPPHHDGLAMLMTGKEYLESIRDGRALYVGRERVHDQTTHPAFAGGARTYAALFDLKCDPALRDIMTFEEGGERYSMYYLQPRSQQDLRRRNRAHRRIANFCFGLLGRTPDAFAGNLTGLSMKPEVLDSEPGGHRDNLLAIYRHVRRNDLFATYAIVPPQAARNRSYYLAQGLPQPALRVTAEDDRGVTLNGMKMLASGAAYAHEVLVGNVMPLAPDQLKESITCVIPLNLPGLMLWSREPFNRPGMHGFDRPLTARFDESDCMLVFKDARVPWEKVIVHDNPGLSRDIYINRRREPDHPLHRRTRHPGRARDARPAGGNGGRLRRHDRRTDRGLRAVQRRVHDFQPSLSLRRDSLGHGASFGADRHRPRAHGRRSVPVSCEHRCPR